MSPEWITAIVALCALPIPVVVILTQQRLLGWRIERLHSIAQKLDDGPAKAALQDRAERGAEILVLRLAGRVPLSLRMAIYVYLTYWTVIATGHLVVWSSGGRGLMAGLDIRSPADGLLFLIGLAIFLCPAVVFLWGLTFFVKKRVSPALPLSRIGRWIDSHEDMALMAMGIVMVFGFVIYTLIVV